MAKNKRFKSGKSLCILFNLLFKIEQIERIFKLVTKLYSCVHVHSEVLIIYPSYFLCLRLLILAILRDFYISIQHLLTGIYFKTVFSYY